MGGKRVYYVGERETHLSRLPAVRTPSSSSRHQRQEQESGLSSTRKFQYLLQTKFRLVERIEIPNWWLNEDDLTVWERKDIFSKF